MRYVLQGLSMLSDIIILAVAIGISIFYPSLIVWLLAIVAIRIWWKNGGFEAWRPSTIKKFLSNARRYGL